MALLALRDSFYQPGMQLSFIVVLPEFVVVVVVVALHFVLYIASDVRLNWLRKLSLHFNNTTAVAKQQQQQQLLWGVGAVAERGRGRGVSLWWRCFKMQLCVRHYGGFH